MENILGITADELKEALVSEDTNTEYADRIASITKENLMILLNQDEREDWKETAQRIARLPGLEPDVKIACMILGLENILGQLFLLHGTAGGLGAKEALHAFSIYCEAAEIPTSKVTAWIAFYFLNGVIVNNTPGPIKNLATVLDMNPEAVAPGPMAKVMSGYSAKTMEVLITTLAELKPKVEELGITFTEDMGLFEEIGARRAEEVRKLISEEDVQYAPDVFGSNE